jgi:hypothetical protein
MLAESVRVFANRYGVLPGPHLPEPLARGLPAARRQVVGDALRERDVVVVVVFPTTTGRA